tara:strand:- start:1224 stop:1538 length:315 start_codon:yes stop_codon:yes gene_type:complete
VPVAVVHRNLRFRKIRIGERAHGYRHAFFIAIFYMKHIRTADRTEAKSQPCTLITNPQVFGEPTGNLERRQESRERSKNTAGAFLTLQAMAHANADRVAVDLNA